MAIAYPIVDILPDIKSVVYCWTRNGTPCYVGYTTGFISKRIYNHYHVDKELFQNKLRKHSKEFKCHIIAIDQCIDELKRLEILYIASFNTFRDDNPMYGYNLTRGGDGFYKSEETRKKMSDSRYRYLSTDAGKEQNKRLSDRLKGKPQSKEHIAKKSKALSGRSMSEEQRKLLSKICKGRTSSFKGKRHSLEARLKISIARKQYFASKTK